MSLKFEFTASEVVENGRVKNADISTLREWAKYESLPRVNDEQLCQFLLSCNNDVQKTKETILANYRIKYNAKSITTERDMFSKELTEQVNVVESCIIPRRTKDNYMIIFQRLKNFSVWNFNFETSLKYLFMTMDMGLQKNPPDGLIALFDMKGVGLMHLTKLRVGPLRTFFNFLQEGLPCQIRGIHVFNTVYFVDKLIAIIKPFMKKELYDMLYFHPSNMNMEDFFQNCIEAECLPSDYGGKLPSVRELDAVCVEKLKEMKEWFQNEEEMRKNYKPPK